MASLNTLRTRGGVVVSVVIGIALLAFLVGDFAPRSCSEFNVGVIDGDKISYQEYSERSDLYSAIMQRMTGREALSADEQDQARNMAWESFVMDHSYRPGFEKMGLWASEAEQVDMTTGAYVSPVITGSFPSADGGVDMEQLRMFSSNPANGFVWNYLKEQMNIERVMDKYVTLITKGMFTTDLEVESAVALANRSTDARVVKRAYTDIADSLVTLTKGDIKVYFDAHKNKYKQQASREVEYVVFDLLPSAQDYEDAKKYIDEMAAEFEASEAPMQYATLNSQVRPDNRFMAEAQLDKSIAAAVWNNPAAMYGPVLSGDTYTIAREAEVKMLPDSLGAKHILLRSGQTELADSLVAALKGGADFAALSEEYSNDPGANRAGGDLGKFSPDQMVPEFSDAVTEAKVGDVITVDTQFGLHVIEVTYKSAPVRKARIATIKYKVDPSSYTQQNVYGEASTFLSEAAGSYDNFKKAATEAALSKRVARIRNIDRNVSGLNDSREMVRWAFNGQKGDVSDIMEIGGDYVVAAITGVREDGFATPEEAADDIRPILRREKKAEMIIAGLNGNSISQIEPDTANVITANGVTFGSFYIDGIGVEQRLIGGITSANAGALAKPVIGEQGVYVFEVTNVGELETPVTVEDEKVRIEAMATSYVPQRAVQAMGETTNITDQRVKFF